MKILIIVFALFLLVGVANADPRMETNDNFCHFIYDANNTDNEVFQAGCDSSIIRDDDAQTALGNAFVVKHSVPREVADAILGPDEPVEEMPENAKSKHYHKWKKTTRELILTNETVPGQACNLVDSNGTEYASNDWISTITYSVKNNNEYGILVMRLICRNGAQQ